MVRFSIIGIFLSYSLNSFAFISPNTSALMAENSLLAETIPVNIEEIDLKEATKLSLKIKEDLHLIATRSKLTEDHGKTIWIGRILGDPLSSLVIGQSKKGYSINLFSGGKQLWSLKKGDQYFLVNSKNLEGKDVLHDDELQTEFATTAGEVTTKSSDKFIDVLMVYTPAALGQDADIENTITARVATINNYLKDSCINYRYRLVHVAQVTYTENVAGIETDLQNLYNGAGGGTGPLSAVQALKTTYGADLVQIITYNTHEATSCGIGLINSPNEYNMFKSVTVSQYHCGPLTMAHELGHNLGLQHDIYQYQIDSAKSTKSSNLTDGFGYINVATKKRSIMSYNRYCSDSGFSCARIGQFSNARQKVDNIAFGVADAANAVNFVNKNFGYVANFADKKSSYSPDIDKNCVASGDEKDVNCYIATAAMGSYMQNDVQTLRSFRDNILKKSEFGQKLVNFYYEHSPNLAKLVSESSRLKTISQVIIKSISWIINNYITVLLSLSLFGLICLSKKLWGIGIISFFFLLFFSTYSQADVAVPSILTNTTGSNPATGLLIKKPLLVALNYDQVQSSGKADGIAKEVSGTGIELQAGFYGAQMFFDATFYSQTKKERVDENPGIPDEKRDLTDNNFEIQIGTLSTLIGRVGFKYRTEDNSDSDDFYGLKRNIMGLGYVSTPSTLMFGLGFDYIQETGDSVADTKWIETYVGVASGSYNGSTGYLIEYSLRRRPEVLSSDSNNITAYGQSLAHNIVFETADYNFIIGNKIRLSFFQKTEDAVEDFNDELKSTGYSIGFGGNISLLRCSYALDYKITNYSDALETNDKLIALNLTWGATSGAAPAAPAASDAPAE